MVFSNCLLSIVFCVSTLASDTSLLENNKIIAVPIVVQTTPYSCGSAVVKSLLNYYGIKKKSEYELNKILNASEDNGIEHTMIMRYLQELKFNVQMTLDMTLDELKACIDKGHPVICAIQAWETHPCNYQDKWDCGHYVLAIGYDKNNVYFMDPSTPNHYTYIPCDEFLLRWHDIAEDHVKLIHLGIWIIDAPPQNSSLDVEKLKMSHIGMMSIN
jgi:predicted double-glycine peptidase